jgi:predicted enzyme related to lactoylglutathione lyase
MHPQYNLNLSDSTSQSIGTQRQLHLRWTGNVLRRSVFAALLGLACSAPAFSAEAAFPALVAPASQEHHIGKIIFVELLTPDLMASKQFYGSLFGWTFHDMHVGALEYAEASLNGQVVAGLIHKSIASNEHKQPAWLSFIAVRNVDAAKKTAVDHGAKVLFEPHNVPDRGREAVFADPQGAVFAVLASSSGDPADVLATPGEWIWSSLITLDPDTDAAFYQTLFDYEVFELPAGPNSQHLMLASDNYARASANSLPADKAITPPHWLNYVRVDDTAKMAAKVVALGGKVLVEPRIDRHGGKVAVVADISGAPFGLIEWPETESKEVSK